jgi:hypothetical protein
MKYKDKGRLQPPTAQGGEYIYSPPAWRVCNCDNGRYVQKIKSGAGSALDGAEYYLTIPCRECADSPIPGRIPLFYTPEQWQEAGGVLTDDTPVWIYEVNKYRWTPWVLAEYKYASQMKYKIIIATSAGKPPEDWRGE